MASPAAGAVVCAVEYSAATDSPTVSPAAMPFSSSRRFIPFAAAAFLALSPFSPFSPFSLTLHSSVDGLRSRNVGGRGSCRADHVRRLGGSLALPKTSCQQTILYGRCYFLSDAW